MDYDQRLMAKEQAPEGFHVVEVDQGRDDTESRQIAAEIAEFQASGGPETP